LTTFFHADYISPFKSHLLEIGGLLNGRFGDVARCVELAAVGSFVDLKFNYFFVGVDEVLVVVLIL
jgi:hypothetical protein